MYISLNIYSFVRHQISSGTPGRHLSLYIYLSIYVSLSLYLSLSLYIYMYTYNYSICICMFSYYITFEALTRRHAARLP